MTTIALHEVLLFGKTEDWLRRLLRLKYPIFPRTSLFPSGASAGLTYQSEPKAIGLWLALVR